MYLRTYVLVVDFYTDTTTSANDSDSLPEQQQAGKSIILLINS